MNNLDNNNKNTQNNKTETGQTLIQKGLAEFFEAEEKKKAEIEKRKQEIIKSPELFIKKYEIQIILDQQLKYEVLTALQSELELQKQLLLEFAKTRFMSEFAAKSYEKAVEEVNRFENLIKQVNLIKYTPADGKPVTVAVHDKEQGTITEIGQPFNTVQTGGSN